MAAATMPTIRDNGKRLESTVVPPLENGDRLTLEEFERRYQAMPHLKKAELIEGVVYCLPQYARTIMANRTPN